MKKGKFSYRILLVDDDGTVCRLGAAILQSQGYEVICVSDGFVGLSAPKKSLPDLIISDLQMPRMNGFEAHGSFEQGLGGLLISGMDSLSGA